MQKHTGKVSIAVLLIALVSLAALPVSALPGASIDHSGLLETGSTWYVATTGDDADDCATPLTPCASINAALAQANFVPGDTILVAEGMYTGTENPVVTVDKDANILGGWSSDFVIQTGFSIIDGERTRYGILIENDITITLERFVVQNGNATNLVAGTGGGLTNLGSLTLTNSFVKNNVSESQGGGIFNDGNLSVYNSTIQNNVAIYGGGIHFRNSGNNLAIENSTITGNQARFGGGIRISKYSSSLEGERYINNSTIAFNFASDLGGGLENYESSLTPSSVSISNSIIALNSAPAGGDCRGTITTSFHNILGDTSDCVVTPGDGDLFNIDPQLSSISIGMLPYHVLLSSSPAIDAGQDCLTTDQRGVARPQGSACDIGAYEYTSPGVAAHIGVSSGSPQRAFPLKPLPKKLVAYVTDDIGSPVSSVNVTFTAPDTGASGTFADSGTITTSVDTDESGLAIAPTYTANEEPGYYHVTASVPGLIGEALFELQNVIWFVSPIGDDSNDCETPSTPCASINGATEKTGFIAGDLIKVAEGTYTGNDPYSSRIVSISNGATILGGWNSSFDAQTGYSTIDGQHTWQCVTVSGSVQTTLDRFIFQNCYGDAIESTRLMLSNSLVINTFGSGIYARGRLTVINSTIMNNRAWTGAGIYIKDFSEVFIKNSTITGNRAQLEGGGIYIGSLGYQAVGQITIENSTIAYNTARTGAGIYNYPYVNNNSKLVNIYNTIIANNTASEQAWDCYGKIDTSAHNLIREIEGCDINRGAGDLFNIDPLLSSEPSGLLQYLVLQSSSPALDAGANCLPDDQRGVTRPQGTACDIGAYEFTTPGSATSFGISSGNNQRAAPLTKFTQPLAVYLVDNLGTPVSGASITFTAPETGPGGTFETSGTNTNTVITGASGLAKSVFIANSELGVYKVTATVSGLSGSVEFEMTNAVWFVSPTGNNSNVCNTIVEPCLTIQAAVEKAGYGDLIKVEAGNYIDTIPPIEKSLRLSGGWNDWFDIQTGFSTIYGNGPTPCLVVKAPGPFFVSGFIIRNCVGAGVNIQGATIFKFTNSALIENKKGFYIEGGHEVYITNATLSGNTDGAVSVLGSGKNVHILNSTITNTQSIWAINKTNVYSYIDLRNSILAYNKYPQCVYGSIESLGNNIFGHSYPCEGTITVKKTDRVGIDPSISTLTLNGYHSPIPGSPAINAGNLSACPQTDQRGVARPVGTRCDIGAIEANDVFVPVAKTPNKTITDRTPTFKWSVVPGAANYQIQVWKGTKVNLTTSFAYACVTPFCKNTFIKNLPYGSQRWRIRAKVDGVWGPWSAYQSFKIVRGNFLSNFNTNHRRWSPVNGNWQHAYGQYYTSLGLNSKFTTIKYQDAYKDGVLEVQMKRDGCISCAQQVIIRGSPKPLTSVGTWDTGYSFQYTNSGHISVWRFNGTQVIPLKNWTRSPAVKMSLTEVGQWNTVKVVLTKR